LIASQQSLLLTRRSSNPLAQSTMVADARAPMPSAISTRL
jgi:hypothetical protein